MSLRYDMLMSLTHLLQLLICCIRSHQDWANDQKGWETCRIDGSKAPDERRAEMDRFNNGGNGPNAPRLFLLSTRAGGLGINLVEADTVVFYDQDWVC